MATAWPLGRDLRPGWPGRRTRKPQCASCPHACFCGGFYELDDVPEPPWLIAAEDLVRPIADPRRHESVPAGFRGRLAAREQGDS